MTFNEILSEVNVIFKDVLDNDSIEVTATTTAMDIDEWDSLSHIELVVAMEKKFKIRFTTAEVQSWLNVGELVANIERKLS